MNWFGRDPKKKLGKLLVKAASRGDAKEAERLLDAGADANFVTATSSPPLFRAAYDGDSDGHCQVLRLLLARGAAVDQRNSVGCTALHGAANNGHFGAASILLEAGASKDLRGRGKNALDWAMTSDNAPTVALLQPPAAPRQAPPPRVENPDEVVFFRPLGNRMLEETFNFAARERISLVRNGADGPVEAMTRDSFDAVGDVAALRCAFEIYRAKGGTLAESDVFPGALGKVKPLPGRP